LSSYYIYRAPTSTIGNGKKQHMQPIKNKEKMKKQTLLGQIIFGKRHDENYKPASVNPFPKET
jgi:hypothetical protein